MSEQQVIDENGVVIDHHNFKNYFFDVRRHGPQPGQIMAKFAAVAVFGNGPEKKDIVKVLLNGKAQAAAMVMRKIHCAAEPDCYRVCREMCEDLMSGMTEAQVCEKEYEFLLEAFYYTKKEYVPRNDPHWETIELMDFDVEKGEFRSRIEM